MSVLAMESNLLHGMCASCTTDMHLKECNDADDTGARSKTTAADDNDTMRKVWSAVPELRRTSPLLQTLHG